MGEGDIYTRSVQETIPRTIDELEKKEGITAAMSRGFGAGQRSN